MPLQFGVALPNLGFGISPQESEKHRDLVLAAAEQAEALGYDSVWVGDHLALPKNPRLPYPYGAEKTYLASDSPLLDPIATAAFVAGRTKRVKLGFGVLVAPYRHPLVAAKLLATIDVLSSGRVILGVGVGWMPEEFEATGADFKHRGAVTDEWIAYVRAAWASDYPEFHGKFYRISGMSVLPRPAQKPGVPIWIGGVTRAAVRRAALLGDGWDALHTLPEALTGPLAELRRIRREQGLDLKRFAVNIRGGPLRLLERADESPRRQPLTGTREQVLATLRAYEAMGVTSVVLGIEQSDQPGLVRPMERFAREILPTFRKQ